MTDNFKAYVTSQEHIADELRRLDLLIRLRMLKQRSAQPAGPLDQFKGLVVSESEVAGLLMNMATPPADEIKITSGESEQLAVVAALSQIESKIAERLAASQKEEVYLSLSHLSGLFQLTRFEQQCLLICLAPELDRRYEKLYAYLQDDVTRKKPSVDLVLTLTASSFEERVAARQAFQPRSPLLRYRLVRLTSEEEQTPLLSRFLKLEDRIVDFLLGIHQMDARLERIALIERGTGALAEVVPQEAKRKVLEIVSAHFEQGPAVRGTLALHLHGPYGSGKRALAETAAQAIGLPLLVVDAERMIDSSLPLEELAWLAGREALLQSALLCFENLDALAVDNKDKPHTDLLLEIAKECSWVTFLIGTLPWRPRSPSDDLAFADVYLSAPGDGERVSIWTRLAVSRDIADSVKFGELASKFRFTQGQIRDAIVAAHNTARWRPVDQRQIKLADLTEACRAQSGQKLNTLARKVKPVYTWDDIVLPEEVLSQLREICQRVVYRHRVIGDWGFGKKLSMGKGVNALFAGPSGAGKTMASEIIANELELDLYKIDLSGVVSKYIGETEKNLDRVFSAAEDANAVLFFDEADALFGKRSEVRDSHDRYANIEISYLLQKMEEYEGVAILATNLRANLDESFTRRLAFTIHFPFPDETSRLLIWKGIWPPQLAIAEGVDLEFISRQFKLSGGNIKNVALGAAFLAAGDGGRVTMSHLLHAIRREYQKLGKPMSSDQQGPLAKEVSA
ncbi:MAG: AAA family ATPase [Rudaea sp.]